MFSHGPKMLGLCKLESLGWSRFPAAPKNYRSIPALLIDIHFQRFKVIGRPILNNKLKSSRNYQRRAIEFQEIK